MLSVRYLKNALPNSLETVLTSSAFPFTTISSTVKLLILFLHHVSPFSCFLFDYSNLSTLMWTSVFEASDLIFPRGLYSLVFSKSTFLALISQRLFDWEDLDGGKYQKF